MSNKLNYETSRATS